MTNSRKSIQATKVDLTIQKRFRKIVSSASLHITVMAQVLAVQSAVDSHHHMGSSGLRRNKSSQSLLVKSSKQSSPRRSRKASPPQETIKERRGKKQPQPSYDHSQDANPSHTSLLLRRTESETILHSPHKRRSRPSLRNYQPPPVTILKNTQAPPSSPSTSSPPERALKYTVNESKQIVYFKSEDDTSIKPEVSRHVDYLTYNWQEEELWNSWRHIVSNRSVYGERSRLENASWRTWWKQKNDLNTLAPERLNWYKDNDVTWLYGPLQTPNQYSLSQGPSEPQSRLSKSNSFCGTKKPILKKRSMSELMLQKSISNSSLVRQAAAAVQAQQTRRGSIARRTSDFTPYMSESPHKEGVGYFSSSSTSGLQTPSEQGEKKHIQFADKVTQCIAVEIKGMEEEDDDSDRRLSASCFEDGYSDDEGVLMMRRTRRRSHPHLPSRRRSSAGDNKMIEMLPATTLKDRPDTPDVIDGLSHTLTINESWRPGRLPPSPSQETLRPTDPKRNFLIPDESDNFINPYDVEDTKGENGLAQDEELMLRRAHDQAVRERGLRRTASGMLMPEGDMGDAAYGGVFGTFVDTVNTARDIAHVIWNVGWRR